MLELTYTVTSKRAQVVDGLGVFLEGETKVFPVEANERFKQIRGVNLLPANLPEDVELIINLNEYDEEVS